MQRFGRKVVYVVVGDGVEEEQAAKKVMDQKTSPPATAARVPCRMSSTGQTACLCFFFAVEVLCLRFPFLPAVLCFTGKGI